MIDELEVSPRSNEFINSAKIGPNHNTIEAGAADIPSITIENMDLEGQASKRRQLNDMFITQKTHVDKENQLKRKKGSQPNIT